VADVLGQAPQLYDLHLDQALLVLVLAMKRTRRSPKLHAPRRPDYREQRKRPYGYRFESLGPS
jgi:hypothetical protein